MVHNLNAVAGDMIDSDRVGKCAPDFGHHKRVRSFRTSTIHTRPVPDRKTCSQIEERNDPNHYSPQVIAANPGLSLRQTSTRISVGLAAAKEEAQ